MLLPLLKMKGQPANVLERTMMMKAGVEVLLDLRDNQILRHVLLVLEDLEEVNPRRKKRKRRKKRRRRKKKRRRLHAQEDGAMHQRRTPPGDEGEGEGEEVLEEGEFRNLCQQLLSIILYQLVALRVFSYSNFTLLEEYMNSSNQSWSYVPQARCVGPCGESLRWFPLTSSGTPTRPESQSLLAGSKCLIQRSITPTSPFFVWHPTTWCFAAPAYDTIIAN
jgi:hypothetical protein